MSTEEVAALAVVAGGSRGRRAQSVPVRAMSWAYLALLGLYFLVPLMAMARFAFQNVPVALLSPDKILTGWSAAGLISAITDPEILSAARTSAILVVGSLVLNLVLILPLAIVVDVAFPSWRHALAGITLVPWVIPPIALVVGVAATFRVAAPWFLSSPLCLIPFYALWSMPFAYRAIDAGLRSINSRTLVDASRSMGASFSTILLRVLIPNLGPSLVAASGLTAAFVLGEFAFASLLLKTTLPTQMVIYQRSDPRGGLALALLVMMLSALAIGAMVLLLRRRGLNISATGI